jgi:hypothetical protein
MSLSQKKKNHYYRDFEDNFQLLPIIEIYGNLGALSLQKNHFGSHYLLRTKSNNSLKPSIKVKVMTYKKKRKYACNLGK